MRLCGFLIATLSSYFLFLAVVENVEGQIVFELDVTPQLDRLSNLYSKFNKGVSNFLGWPNVRNRVPNSSPASSGSLKPQSVYFSQNADGVGETGASVAAESDPIASESEVYSTSVQHPSYSGNSPRPGPNHDDGLVTYVSQILENAGVDPKIEPADLTHYDTVKSSEPNSRPENPWGNHPPQPTRYSRGRDAVASSAEWVKGPPSSAPWWKGYGRSKPPGPPPPPRHYYRPHGPPPPGRYKPGPPPPQYSHGPPPPRPYGPPSHGPPSYGPTKVVTHHHHQHSHGHKKHHHGWGWKCPVNPPPFIYNTISDVPRGATIRTGTGVLASKSDLPQNAVPTPPTPYSVGVKAALPEGYTNVYAERYDIAVGSNGSPSVHREVHHRPTAAQAMANRSADSQPGIFTLDSNIATSPYVSVPLNGADNPQFQAALDNRRNAIREGPRQPFATQLETLLQLYNEMETVEKENEAKEEKERQKNGGWSAPPPIKNDPSAGSGSDLQVPVVALLVQRFSLAEPNSSERGVLDSVYNFGPQASRIMFGDLTEIMDAWKAGTDPAAPVSPLNLNSFAATAFNGFTDQSPAEAMQDAINNRVRNYVKGLRDASAKVHDTVEEMALQFFDQQQYFIELGGCPVEIDPQRASSPIANNGASGRPNMNDGPPSDGFLPR